MHLFPISIVYSSADQGHLCICCFKNSWQFLMFLSLIKKLTFIWNNFFAPVLIQKMVNKSKQLEAVKFIQALNIAHKYPLLPVMRSYIDHAAVAGKMIRIRGGDFATQVHLCCSILYYKHYTIKVVRSSWFLNYLYTLADCSWCKRAHASWNIAEVH